ncbi:MAG: nitroreductase family protein [Promethearchaeota archaeon]
MEMEESLSPLGKYEPGMNWNPVEKVIFERRSIRSYKQKPLPESMIKRILEAARFAPSAGNAQPWKFVVINSREIIDEMERDAVQMCKKLMKYLDYSKSFLKRIFVKQIIKLKKNQLHPIPYSVLLQVAKGRVGIFHNAPTIILMFLDTRGVGDPLIDIGIAGQNMVLAAHSLGAGTCWIGFFSVLMYMKKWRKFFRVKKPFKLVNTLALGYPKGKFDGMIPREVQPVEWIEGTVENPKRRIEKQGV